MYNIICMNLPDCIRSTRQILGYSQVELAALSGVSLPTLQNIEAGKGNPSLDTINLLFKSLELRLTHTVEPADWDLLAACGLALTPLHQTKIVFSKEVLLQQIKRAIVELENSHPVIAELSRKQEAL